MAGMSGTLETGKHPCPKNTVLVVEDNPQAAKLLSLHLTRAGYEVMVAGNGIQALEAARECHPMAITLDILLPDQDGWQVLAELKGSPRTRDIPVVIVSVLDRQALGFRLGASEYLVKPVERAELLQALRRCVPREGGDSTCRRVMVVHTDPGELKLLSLIVAQDNYDVIQALGVDEAVNLARCSQPDLVVTDLLAGDMDYFGLLEGLKGMPETAHIPVLALIPPAFTPEELASTEGGIEFVLTQDKTLIEERLLTAITLVFKKDAPSGGGG
jgi:CheY-like chemotaxis protein